MGNSNEEPDAGVSEAKDLEDRLSEATSDKTLNDLEENEANVGSGSSEVDPGPAPDGALDESNEVKDAGPM